MPKWQLVLAFIALTGPTCAQGRILMSGVGALTCAEYLYTPSLNVEAEVWLKGFWTAANVYNGQNSLIGDGIPFAAIMVEVRKECAEKPGDELGFAAARTFHRFREAAVTR